VTKPVQHFGNNATAFANISNNGMFVDAATETSICSRVRPQFTAANRCR